MEPRGPSISGAVQQCPMPRGHRAHLAPPRWFRDAAPAGAGSERTVSVFTAPRGGSGSPLAVTQHRTRPVGLSPKCCYSPLPGHHCPFWAPTARRRCGTCWGYRPNPKQLPAASRLPGLGSCQRRAQARASGFGIAEARVRGWDAATKPSWHPLRAPTSSRARTSRTSWKPRVRRCQTETHSCLREAAPRDACAVDNCASTSLAGAPSPTPLREQALEESLAPFLQGNLCRIWGK